MDRARTIRDSVQSAFTDEFRGETILPGDPGYDAARIVWNGMVDRHPAVVARCASTDDVIQAVRFAREQDLVVAVRCGGHSVGGFSTCDGGILVDLSLMRGVRVDPERRVAHVRGGSLLRDLDEAAQAFGLACPVGVVGHTGVAGLTLGGGMGRLQRRYGFSVDSMLAVELVTADGRVVRVSGDEHPELFWGMRGAGPNFGVVTAFEFRLHPVGPDVTHGSLLFPTERAREVAGAYGQAAAAEPQEIFLSMVFGLAGEEHDLGPDMLGRPIVWIAATHAGSLDDAERDLAPLRALAPLRDTIARRPYLAVQTANDEAMAWGKRFYMKGGFVDDLGDDAVDACVERAADQPGGCSISLWAQGGAIGRVLPESMAFTGREAAFWLGVESFWVDPSQDAAHVGWGRRTMDALTPFTTAGHYVNDMVESGDDVVRSIYGDAKYRRLVNLKREWDPDNVFRMNQNVRPDGPG
jgi:FAD/FMN-containing dehydrogenase